MTINIFIVQASGDNPRMMKQVLGSRNGNFKPNLKIEGKASTRRVYTTSKGRLLT